MTNKPLVDGDDMFTNKWYEGLHEEGMFEDFPSDTFLYPVSGKYIERINNPVTFSDYAVSKIYNKSKEEVIKAIKENRPANVEIRREDYPLLKVSILNIMQYIVKPVLVSDLILNHPELAKATSNVEWKLRYSIIEPSYSVSKVVSPEDLTSLSC